MTKNLSFELQPPPQNELAAIPGVAPADLIEALMAIPQNAPSGPPSSAGGFGQRMSRGLSRRKSKARQVQGDKAAHSIPPVDIDVKSVF